MFTSSTANRIRISAIAGSIASWGTMLWFILFLTLQARSVAYVGLPLCVLAWLTTLVLAFPVRCPRCTQRLLITSRLNQSPNWKRAVEQYVPYTLVAKGRLTCPHCSAELSLFPARTAT
jgi:DNA-directed RNA polymerase subunit RPC12/RpoP